MSQPSTIDTLPAEAREQLIVWLKDRGVTQLEATERVNALLEELGSEKRVSKSSVNRYAKSMTLAGDKMRQAAEQAKIWAAEASAANQGEMGRFVNQMAQTLLVDMILVLQQGKIDEKTQPRVMRQIKDLALALQRLEASAAANLKREDDIRRQAAEEAAKQAMDVARTRGLPDDVVAEFRNKILGVKQ